MVRPERFGRGEEGRGASSDTRGGFFEERGSFDPDTLRQIPPVAVVGSIHTCAVGRVKSIDTIPTYSCKNEAEAFVESKILVVVSIARLTMRMGTRAADWVKNWRSQQNPLTMASHMKM